MYAERGLQGLNYYVDVHANLLSGLAGIENRALTAQEAEARIAVCRESNIKLSVAAPAFDPARHTPEAFLRQRDEAIAAISPETQPLHVVGGAVLPLAWCGEHPKQLRQFALGDSGYLLVDLPKEPFSERFCETLSRLHIVSGLCMIAVDIERYFDIWSPENWFALRQTGILLQVSVNGLLQSEYRKLSLYLLANQYAHFVATGSRAINEPLRFTEAMRMIQRSLPAQLYRRIKNNAGLLLSNAEPAVFLR